MWTPLGDRVNQDLALAEVGRQMAPHAFRHLGVDVADAVAIARRPDGVRRQVERLTWLSVVGFAEPLQASGVGAEPFGPDREVGLDQLGSVLLVTGGHRCMRGEADVRGKPLLSTLEIVVARLQIVLQPLELKQGAVPLVDVPHRRPDTQRLESSRASDPEQDLLAETHLSALDVEHRGDRTIRRVVHRDVAVEEEQRHPAHLGQPHARRDLPAGKRNPHHAPPVRSRRAPGAAAGG